MLMNPFSTGITCFWDAARSANTAGVSLACKQLSRYSWAPGGTIHPSACKPRHISSFNKDCVSASSRLPTSWGPCRQVLNMHSAFLMGAWSAAAC